MHVKFGGAHSTLKLIRRTINGKGAGAWHISRRGRLAWCGVRTHWQRTEIAFCAESSSICVACRVAAVGFGWNELEADQ